MIELPKIVETEAQITAVIRLTVPRAEIQKVMGPAIQEVLSTVAAQKIAPAGSPTVAELLIGGLEKPTDQPLHQTLSKREFQIFCKLARGQSVSIIAEELFLSVKTVSTYRTRILEKMGMKSNADLTYYAIKNGLVE